MTGRVGGSILAILTLVWGWGCGEGPPATDDTPTAEAGTLPSGYVLRLDRSNRDPAAFRVASTEAGMSVKTGPSGILYRPEDLVPAGDYAVAARFTEISAPLGHREGVGLFIGGNDLAGPNQSYTYFLVRADGKYLIKRRAGSTTANVTNGWIASTDVARAGHGDVVNELRIQVAGDRVRFQCNGAQLAELPTSDVDSHGIAGVRVNHNLDVQMTGFAIER